MQLAGITLRNYKAYKGTYFTSFPNSQNFVGIIGDNGVGKSTLLHALDIFFNANTQLLQAQKNKESKAAFYETYVGGIFKVSTNELSPQEIVLLTPYSDKNKAGLKIEKTEKTLFFSIATFGDGSVKLLFHNGKDGFEAISTLSDDEQKVVETLYKKLIARFQYIYIGAEIDIAEFLKIGSSIAERIHGTNFAKRIKEYIDDTTIESLNTGLSDYLKEQLVDPLKEIDSEYDYRNNLGKGSQSNITRLSLAQAIIDIFFRNKNLTFKNIGVDDLSSGQRRRALIDYTIATFASNANEHIVLAIDEPEISCDAIARFKQFQQLLSLSRKGVCVLVTTHWYGWIPMEAYETCCLVNEDINGNKTTDVKQGKDYPFGLANAPYDIKSCSDFLSSIGSIAQKEVGRKFIVCEGISDYNYIKSSVDEQGFELIAMSGIRGRSMVEKIAQYWNMQWSGNTSSAPKNVFFLIDTDPGIQYGDEVHRVMKKAGGFEIAKRKSEGDETADIEDLLDMSAFLVAFKKIVSTGTNVSERERTFIASFTKEQKDFVDNLSVKYPDHNGKQSLGLDVIQMEIFRNTYGPLKEAVSKEYKPESSSNYISDILSRV